MDKPFEYDIALSFAGEDRSKVEPIALLLQNHGLKVFYDNFETANLWGKDLYQYLQSIYRDKAHYCIIFCSKEYAEKAWTLHELRQAQERSFLQDHDYILPLKLDDSIVPGINSTTGYIDYNKYTIDELVKIILEKCKKIPSSKILVNNSLRIMTTDKNIVSLSLNDIIFISNSSKGKIATIATTSGLFFRTYGFKNIELNLNFYPFVRCSQFTIINVTHLVSFNLKEKLLIMKNNFSFRFTNEYSSDILKSISQ